MNRSDFIKSITGAILMRSTVAKLLIIEPTVIEPVTPIVKQLPLGIVRLDKITAYNTVEEYHKLMEYGNKISLDTENFWNER